MRRLGFDRHWQFAYVDDECLRSHDPNHPTKSFLSDDPLQSGHCPGARSMALIDDLISQVQNEKLRQALASAAAQIRSEKTFGLVFEEHLPETVQLPSLPIRKGSMVTRLRDKQQQLFTVADVNRDLVTIRYGDKVETVSAADVVATKRFGEPIFPALRVLETVRRGGDKNFHVLINAENFHALQLLLYTHESKIDVIYIDPPYNTGAKDWKYNNNYVDENDQWRHSRWLSFMKKRLLLARRLLKSDGVLIIAIDDNENHHLQMLLEQCFPEREITTVVIVQNPRGNISNNFAYVHEYAHFMIPRDHKVVNRLPKENLRPRKLRRWGHNSERTKRPTMFYPVLVRDGEIVGFGEIAPPDHHPPKNVQGPDGIVQVWPIDQEGVERRWNFSRKNIPKETDRLVVLEIDGLLDIFLTEEKSVPKTVWTGGMYDAGKYGASLVTQIVGKEFPFPKSLYTIEQCLRAITSTRKDAIILDFFAGSGTTLHATCLLNAQDGGCRTSVVVTNNEVGEQRERQLLKARVRPGSDEWESEGICRSITWPRCKYAIQGKRDDNTDLEGEYLVKREGQTENLRLSNGFEENVAYCQLEFLDPDDVEYGNQFQAILPILWLMAGAKGDISGTPTPEWFISESCNFAVLLLESRFSKFNEAIRDRKDITHVFLVTDSEEAFREMKSQINGRRSVKMLYKDYLDNFKLNTDATV
jgi:adenine-specific DNA-methyltransferase